MIEMGILIGISMAIVAVGAWIGRIYWTGRRYLWPGGLRGTTDFQGYRVHVITQDEWANPSLMLACAKAVAAAGHAWVLAGNSGARGKIGEMAICFMSDSLFDHHRIEHLRRSAAFLDTIPRRFGKHMPCMVVRNSLKAHVLESGDPVIHEAVCVLDDWAPPPEPDTWELSAAALSVQKQALECFSNAGTWHIQY